LICLICSKDFNSVASHVRKHGITIKEYRVEFDIPFSIPLEEKSTTKKREENAKLHYSEKRMKEIHALSMEKIRGVKRGRIYIPKSSAKKSIEAVTSRESLERRSRNCRERFFRDRKEIVADYNNGMGFDELAIKHKVGHTTLRRYFKVNNLKYSGKAMENTKIKVIKDYLKGMGLKKLSEKYNIKLDRIRMWVYSR